MENLAKEIDHFNKKYKLEFNIISDEKLTIPEYKIDLLNKNKKIIKKIENIEKIEDISFKKNYVRKKFMPGNINRNFKMQNKFKYHSQKKKNYNINKKIINY